MIFMIFCKRIIRISIPKNNERTAGQMRKSFFLLLTTVYLILMSLLAAVSAQTPDGSIKIFVDGNEISSGLLPVISNSRTLVPVRPVAESCGISVSWNSETGGITLSKDVLSVSITVGSCEMKVYNSVIDEMTTVTLEQAPMIIDSSTYVALRPVMEAFGSKVDWDADNRYILVTSSDKNADKVEDKDDNTGGTVTDIDGISYSGFREMKDHKVAEGAPHGLYGRVKATSPITQVRCRLVGTKMDYSLFFRPSDNITDYNIFTYFDKLICFSDAGLGAQRFEIYAATEGSEAELLFYYDYTVATKDEIPSVETEAPEKAEPPSEDKSEEAPENSDEPSEDISADKPSEEVEARPENAGDAPIGKDNEITVTVSYHGFVRMTGDKVTEGAPHGLYGKVVADQPITEIRCRLVGTDMDYTVTIPQEDNVFEYNVFTYFDRFICFSDAGLGRQRFEIYAGVLGAPSVLLFGYDYTVTEKAVAADSITDSPDKGDIDTDVCLPLEGTIKVTSPYGFRAYNKWEFHKGVDIISSSLNILAVADGTVVDCATGRNSGVGNYVAIQHGGGWVSLYYHLASYDVEIGDTVKKGQKFAIMGNTGGNYGVHLHFMTCDNWYGGIWATQNTHHTPPHEYVPQLLTDVLFYNPSFEKVNKDKMILCRFRFPNVIEKGRPFSISSSGAFVASEKPLASITLTVTDAEGNVVLSETINDPEYYVSGIYTYTNISTEFDMMCEFDSLPVGALNVTVTTVSTGGRERVVYEKDFEVVDAGDSTEEERAEADALLTPEDTLKTDAFENGEEENPDGEITDDTVTDAEGEGEITADAPADGEAA